MKKQYINPETTIISVQVKHHMLAGSVSLDGNNDVRGIRTTDQNFDAGSMTLKSRGSAWDDEE